MYTLNSRIVQEWYPVICMERAVGQKYNRQRDRKTWSVCLSVCLPFFLPFYISTCRVPVIQRRLGCKGQGRVARDKVLEMEKGPVLRSSGSSWFSLSASCFSFNSSLHSEAKKLIQPVLEDCGNALAIVNYTTLLLSCHSRWKHSDSMRPSHLWMVPTRFHWFWSPNRTSLGQLQSILMMRFRSKPLPITSSRSIAWFTTFGASQKPRNKVFQIVLPHG